MKSNYKRLGDYIHKVDERNKIYNTNLQGLSMTKEYRASTSNIVGTDLSSYKIMRKNRFVCDFMSVIRVYKLPVVLHKINEIAIVSPAYTTFEVNDTSVLLPEYLMLWFRRSEFDRYAFFKCDSAIRGGFDWEALCDCSLPIPSIPEQQKIVDAYNANERRIAIKRQINDNLEAIIDTMFIERFVDNGDTEKVAFTDTITLLGGGTPQTTDERYWNGDIHFFTPKDVGLSIFCLSTEKTVTELGLANCSSRLYPAFTTFVTCRGTVGNVVLAGKPMAMNQSCYAIQGKDGFPALFVFAFTRFVIATMKKKAIGAVFSALVTKDFEMEETIKPNKPDALQFNTDAEPIFAQILANSKEIEELNKIREILLTKLSSR